MQWTVYQQDGSHTGKVVLCLESVENARHKHISDEYIKPVYYYSISVTRVMGTQETITIQWFAKEQGT